MQSVRERPSDPWIGMIGWVGSGAGFRVWIVDGWRKVEATWRGSDRRTGASDTSSRRQPASVPSFVCCFLDDRPPLVALRCLTSVVCRRVEVVDEAHEGEAKVRERGE